MDILEQPEVRLTSDKSMLEKKISMYLKSSTATLPKRSTMRRPLNPFQKQRLEEQNKQVKSLMEKINDVPSGL